MAIRDPVDFQLAAERRRAARMNQIDALPADVRELVHEYGFTVVKSFMDIGVVKAKHIHHLVETVLNEFSPTRGSFSAQGIRTIHEDVEAKL